MEAPKKLYVDTEEDLAIQYFMALQRSVKMMILSTFARTLY